MRDAAIDAEDTWISPPRRAGGPAHGSTVAAIAGIWQFWLDAEMDITVILPPDTQPFNLFPCGRNAIGRPLLEFLEAEANPTAAVAFNTAFRSRERMRNQYFARRGEDGCTVALLISGAPLFDAAGLFEGYQCTVVDVSDAGWARSAPA